MTGASVHVPALHTISHKIDNLPEFPASTKGALPTGLGNKGRVGEGKAVYALALHSKAVAMTSIPVYNAAAATELSVGGKVPPLPSCLAVVACYSSFVAMRYRLRRLRFRSVHPCRRGWMV